MEPANKNLSSPLGFSLSFERLPTIAYFSQVVALPGLTLGVAQQFTAVKTIPHPGDQISFENLTVSFRVDENLANWSELMEWMIGLGYPRNTHQIQRLAAQDKLRRQREPAVVSDATLAVLDSHMNPVFSVRFTDMFPVQLGGLTYDCTGSSVDYILCEARFEFLLMETIER